MPITAQLSDGRTLEFPDGTDPSIIQRTVKNTLGIKESPAPKPTPLTRDNPDPISNFIIDKLAAAPGLGNAPDIQGSIPGRLIQGLADLPVGALQLGANALGMGDAINQRIKDINSRTEALRGPNAGFDWSRLAGNIASPVGLVAAAKVPIAATRAGKIGQGIAIGGVGGATAPVTDAGDNFASEKAAQIGTGMALGGVIPAASPFITTPVKAAYRGLIEPWMNPAAIKGRAFLEAAGDKADDIINYLRQNKEIVPGSRPTAGEAAAPAGSAEFSALQKQASEIAPTPYAARESEQNAARLASLRTVGKDEAALKAAEATRKSVSDPLYEAARNNMLPVDARPVLIKLDTLLAKNPGNPELVSALTSVRRGLVGPEGRPTYDAQELASSIDGLKAAAAKQDNKFIAGTLKTLQGDLEKILPGYELAQKTFKTLSKPVNQMQVGQYLENKLIPAQSDDAKQKAASYAAALRDVPGTIKRSTGAPRYEKLEQILTPDQMSVVNGIRDDLARGMRYTDLAGKGAKAAPDISGAYSKEKIPGILNRGVMVANAIISRLEGKVNKKLAAEIAADMLNPPKVAETLSAAKTRAERNNALASMVEKYIQTGTATASNTATKK